MSKKAVKKEQSFQPAGKKTWLYMALFTMIAIASVWAVSEQNKEFSFSNFMIYIENASWPWLIVAGLSMLAFIFFEAVAILIICRAVGKPQSFARGYSYSTSDIYFSALTPSATGGQPASAYFMMKDGIDGMLTTAILIANLCMYVGAIIIIGLICFILRFDIFLKFTPVSQILIIVGFLAQAGLMIFFFMMLRHAGLLHRICSWCLRVLCKLRIFKNKEERQAKLDAYMERYRKDTKIIVEHPKAMVYCLLCNLAQRTSQIAVTAYVYVATTGANFWEALKLFFVQCYVVIGANIVPIPGAMGVSDGMMVDGFSSFMSEAEAINLALLSRAFSFYSCFVICGVSTLVRYLIIKRKGR